MNTRPTGCSVQETENGINPLNWRPKHRPCPMELPSGVPSHPSAGLHSREALGTALGAGSDTHQVWPPCPKLPFPMQGAGSCWHKTKAISVEGK